MMYLIATSPLALRWKFVHGITDDETQETTYIYSHGWILLSSMSFMAVILITGCIMVSRYHDYAYLSEGFDAGFGVDLVVLVFCWSEIDVCHHSRTMHHRRNEFSFLSSSSKIRTYVQPSFCWCWSLSDDRYTPLRQRVCGPTRLDAPILLYGACRNTVVRARHLISHRNGSTHWGENPPALDKGHRRVLIIVRCSAGCLHHE